MKKSSRDYRKNNRKKWIIINTRNALLSVVLANSIVQCRIIQSIQADKNLKIKSLLNVIVNTKKAIINLYEYEF